MKNLKIFPSKLLIDFNVFFKTKAEQKARHVAAHCKSTPTRLTLNNISLRATLILCFLRRLSSFFKTLRA